MTRAAAPASRTFLFLQGPPGPFFPLLGAALRERGARVHRINLSGGDRYDWPKGSNAIGQPRWVPR